jgi:hypothetical protein
MSEMKNKRVGGKEPGKYVSLIPDISGDLSHITLILHTIWAWDAFGDSLTGPPCRKKSEGVSKLLISYQMRSPNS